MSYWEKMVWYIWGYDGLIIGWFGIKDGLIDTPKTFSDFFQRVLNVLLTNGLGFGIMQNFVPQNGSQAHTQDSPCSYFITSLLICLAFGLGFPSYHLQGLKPQEANQMFLQ
jgi:hypothetical protein